MKLLWVWALAALSAGAQVRVGAKAGTPLTRVTETTSGASALLNRSYWWTAGPTVEIDLPLRFGVEVNALYRRAGYEGPAGRAQFADQRRVFSGGIWDFPLLAKYRLGGGGVEPFLSRGYTYRRLGDVLRLWAASASHGLTMGGGLRIGDRRVKLSAELRYTYWPNEDLQPALRTRRNQAEVLAGIAF